MIKIVRELLRGTFLYSKASLLYHYSRRLIMKLSFLTSNTKYLPPKKPAGEFKSQYGQDYYLEKFNLVPEGGFFLEIGCNHPVKSSNSFYLEKFLNCTGVSIDGLDYGDLFRLHRPNTKFLNMLIDVSEGELDFYVVQDVAGWENQLSTIHKESLDNGKGFETEIRTVRSMPISAIKEIDRAIDVLLIDVEGHEFSVLQSIDWDKQTPKVIVIENNGESYPRSSLVNELMNKNYQHFARIGVSDEIFLHRNLTMCN